MKFIGDSGQITSRVFRRLEVAQRSFAHFEMTSCEHAHVLVGLDEIHRHVWLNRNDDGLSCACDVISLRRLVINQTRDYEH